MGIDVLLAAWPGVLARHPDARLEVVGDGAAARDLRSRTADLGVADSVSLVGVIDVGGLPDAVRDLDPGLVVAPGEPEALAHRLAEALDGARPSPERCRAHAERFSWDVAAGRHAALYRSVAA